MALFLCSGAGIVSALFSSPLYLLGAIVYLTLMVLLSLKPDWAMYVLLLASFCTAIALDVGPVTVRPDQIVAIAIAPSAFLFLVSGTRPVVTTGLDWLIVAYLFCNLLSSFLRSPDLNMSLQKCLLLAVTFLAYFLTTQLIQTRRILTKVLLLLIVVGVLEAIYGIISVVLFTKGIDIGGAHAPFEDLYARGTFLEGNIFGSFQMMIALLLISFLFQRHFRGSRGLILISLAIVLIALVMSFTRAAWIAFLIGFVSYIIFFQRPQLVRYVRHLPLILLACLVLFVFVYAFSASRKMSSGSLLDVYSARLARIADYRSGTGLKRVQVWRFPSVRGDKTPFLETVPIPLKFLLREVHSPNLATITGSRIPCCSLFMILALSVSRCFRPFR